ncbi:MAG: type II toxin-antitoxin system Phd/YefM family antitoxin [Terriglobales bacterium]
MKSHHSARPAPRRREQKRVSAFGKQPGPQPGSQASYTATEAKNKFGRVLEQAIHGTTVVITKHDSPKAVLISMNQFNALNQAPQLKLNVLSEQFDALLARLQTAKARSGMEAAFRASPTQLGKAALAAARKRA